MGRSKQEIKAEITTPFMANDLMATKYGFVAGASFESEFSLMSLENIWFEIIAFAHFVHEQFFDQHRKEIDEMLANQKYGTEPWYITMALRFQYGFNLVPDHDYFDNGTATTEEIEASKIVRYAAINKAQTSSRLILKIATEVNGFLSPISEDAKESFEAYVDEFIVAGTELTVINYLPDKLYLSIQIKRNALILDETGMCKRDASFPVNEALQAFMKQLPFDGELRLSALVEKLKAVEGVLDATILNAQSAWINPETSGYGVPQPIFISVIPESGYFEIVTFENISYVV